MKKAILAIAAATTGLLGASGSAFANDASGLYVGGFGGVGSSGGQAVEQTGVAHKRGDFNAGYPNFDLKVDVDGKTDHATAGLFGVHTGYRWDTGSKLKPAVELEGIYYWGKQKAALANPATEVLSNVVEWSGQTHSVADLHTLVEEHYGAGEHRFANSMDMKIAMFMLNGVVNYDLGSKLTPYVGGGVGLAAIKMKNGVSYQTSPLNGASAFEIDPVSHADVNHFNSNPNATDLAFAAQVKAGLRFEVSERVSVFTEYRYIHVAASNYTFGSTVYAGHSPTDNWNVADRAMNLHNAAIGIDFKL